jgi:hypothetical protein
LTVYNLQELIIVVDILLLVEEFGSQHQTDGTTREIFQCAPDVRADIQSLIGMVEVIPLPLHAVEDLHVKRSADSNDDLLASAMGVPAAPFTTRWATSNMPMMMSQVWEIMSTLTAAFTTHLKKTKVSKSCRLFRSMTI